MSILTTLLAAGALLCAPGPTNALFAAAGATTGPREAVRLIPIGLLAYLVAIGLLVTGFGDAVTDRPVLARTINLAAAAYLGWSAYRVVQQARANVMPANASRLFWTTLLNPKALIFAFSLYPAGSPLLALQLFVPAFAIAGLAWIMMGYMIACRAPQAVNHRRIVHATAAANLLFAAAIVGNQLGATS